MANQIDTISVPADRGAAGRPAPWGFWASLGWALLAVAVAVMVVVGVGRGLAWWDQSLSVHQFQLRHGHPVGSLLVIFGYFVLIAVLAFAARRAGWSTTAYLALVRPRGRYVLFGILCVVLPILISFAHSMQFDVSEFFRPYGFDRARADNGLLLHVIAIAIVGPVMEEILFRGFIYRVLSQSRIGIAGAIVLTSIAWALMHAGKDPAGMVDTALHGVVWGWLRWYTGSLWAPIVAHVVNNSFATLLIVASLYGWFGIG